MNHWPALAILLTLLQVSSAAVHTKKKPAAKGTIFRKASSKALTNKRSQTKLAGSRIKRTKQTRDRKATPTQARQAIPSSDRYQEIQQALAAKGYLTTPPNGQWDQNSQDAMRRFQSDQNLNSNGKLTSRSIIALGLGPQSTSPKP